MFRLFSLGATKNLYESMCHAIKNGFERDAYLYMCLYLQSTQEPSLNQLSQQYKGEAPLHLAVISGSANCVQMLLVNGADPNLQDEAGNTPLCMASKSGNISVVKKLLGCRAIDPDLENAFGRYPLYIAAENGHLQLVQVLLEKGVDATKTVNGFTPRHKLDAYLKDHKEREKEFENVLSLLSTGNKAPDAGAQYKIIKYGEGLGYKNIQSGICHGIAMMAVQAMIHDERDEHDELKQMLVFNQRTKRMIDVSYERGLKNIDAANKRRIQLVNEKSSTDLLTESEKIDLDIPVFYNGVALYQHPSTNDNAFADGDLYYYVNLPSSICKLMYMTSAQIDKPVSDIVISSDLLRSGGIASVMCCSSVYDENELNQFFKGLKDQIAEHQDINFPMAFRVENYNHSIAISYDPVWREWTLVDANYLPPKRYSDEKAFVKHLLLSLSANDNPICIGFEMYVASKNVDKLKANKIIERWQSRSDWQDMQTVTVEKSTYSDRVKGRWKYVAERLGQVDLYSELMSKGENYFMRGIYALDDALFGQQTIELNKRRNKTISTTRDQFDTCYINNPPICN